MNPVSNEDIGTKASWSDIVRHRQASGELELLSAPNNTGQMPASHAILRNAGNTWLP